MISRLFLLLLIVALPRVHAQVSLETNEPMERSLEYYYEPQQSITDFPNVQITIDEGNSVDPSIDCDANYCYLVWEDFRDGNWEIYFTVVTTNGVKEFPEINISNSAAESVNPDVSVDAIGKVFVTWTEGGELGTVMVAVLNSQGEFILDPVNYESPNCRNPELAAFGDGLCNIVYEQSNIIMQYYLYWERFDVTGTRVCGPRLMSNWEIFDFVKSPTIAADPNGECWTAWHDIYNFQEDIRLAKQEANCSNGPMSLIYDISNDVDYPSITLSPGFFWLNFEDKVGSEYIIRNLRGEDNACQIAPIGLGGSARFPSVGTDNSNGFVAWEHQDGPNSVYVTKFYGCDVLSETMISDGSGNAREPDLYVRKNNAGEFFVVWQDDRNGNWEIYLTGSDIVPPQIGTIAGTVVDDASGLPLKKVQVALVQGGSPVQTAETDILGEYLFENVMPEIYDLEFSYAGYETETVSSFEVVPGLNTVPEVRMTLLPLTLKLIYGPDQEGKAGDPVDNAYVDLYRGLDLVETVGPTDETGVVTLSSLQAGDEIYAYKIIGAGRTDKHWHPEIPEYLLQDLPGECENEEWRAFYFNYLDNQYVESNMLKKDYYDGVVRTIELNHRIAKLDLVMGFGYSISPSAYETLLPRTREQVESFSKYFLNATNGLVMVNSLIIHGRELYHANSDIWVRQEPLPGSGRIWAQQSPHVFEYPPYVHFVDDGYTAGTYKTYTEFDKGDFNHPYFYEALAHEMGHYLLSLGDEYPKKLTWYNAIPPDCNDGYLTYKSSIMSNKLVKDHLREYVFEFCDLNHEDNSYLEQNKFHDGKTCWQYLEEDWNNFESALHYDCRKYILGDPIAWTRPSNAIDFVPGPIIDSSLSTSHEIVIFSDELILSPSAKDVLILIDANPWTKNYTIVITSPLELLLKATDASLSSLEYISYFCESEMDSAITVYGVEPDDRIWITADGAMPIEIAPDTVTGDLSVALERLDESQMFIDYVYAEPNTQGNEITVRLRSTALLNTPPTLVMLQGKSSASSQTMNQIGDYEFEASFSLDPTVPAWDGTFIVSHDTLPEVYIGRWGIAPIYSGRYNRCQMISGTDIVADQLSFADPMYVLVHSTPIPACARGYAFDRLFSASPMSVSFSQPITEGDSLYLRLYAGPQYWPPDPSMEVVRLDIASCSLELLDAEMWELDYYVNAKIGGPGLYMLSFEKDMSESYGAVTGTVSADCPDPGTGLLDVSIDVYANGTGDLVGNAVTDENGYFEILDVLAGDNTVTMVTPLGYLADSEEIPVNLPEGETVNVDFALTCADVIGEPRTIGFWKHQIGVATGGNGQAQVDAFTLCDYLDAIEDHFNSNSVNQVIVYQAPSQSANCDEKLGVAKELLNLKGSVTMMARARQQLMALLLNVAAGYIHQASIISEDGANVSQAITYCDNLIDDPSGDYEKAKTIADLINNSMTVPAGMIPLSTANIAYKQAGLPIEYSLGQNYPNPFNPQTVISYSLPEAAHVRIDIYNNLGQNVTTLVNQDREAGNYTVTWDAREHASGIYLYKIVTRDFVETKKMLLMK